MRLLVWYKYVGGEQWLFILLINCTHCCSFVHLFIVSRVIKKFQETMKLKLFEDIHRVLCTCGGYGHVLFILSYFFSRNKFIVFAFNIFFKQKKISVECWAFVLLACFMKLDDSLKI